MKTYDRHAVGYALAATCKTLRARTGISQEDIASAAGLERAQLSIIERGGGNPKLMTLFRLLLSLNADFAAFGAEMDANLRKRPAKG